MQRHLQESRAADGVLDEAELSARGTLIGTLKTNPSCSCEARAGTVVRWIGEVRIESDVVVWSIEAWVIENIERLHIEAQFEPLPNLKILEERHVHAGLKRPDEDIPAASAKCGFVNVASAGSCGRSRIARRNAVSWIPGLQKRDSEGCGVQDRLSRINAKCALRDRVYSGRATYSANRHERICHKVVPAAEIEASKTAAEIDDAEGLSALSSDEATGAPAVDELRRPSLQFAEFRQFVLIADDENMAAVEIRIGVSGTQILRVVAIVEKLFATLLVQGVGPSVGTGKREALGSPLGHMELQGMVIGNSGGLAVLRVGVEADEGNAEIGVARAESFHESVQRCCANQGVEVRIDHRITVRVDLAVDGTAGRCDGRLVERNRNGFVN